MKTHTPVRFGFVDQDVFAKFSLETSAIMEAAPSFSANVSGQASASADFLDPLLFPTDGPVFNFFDANGNPLAGATVNSSDGCIANNRFVCGSSGPTTVPEPSAWAMMLSASPDLAMRASGDHVRPGSPSREAPKGDDVAKYDRLSDCKDDRSMARPGFADAAV
jgi:hypothetical protein